MGSRCGAWHTAMGAWTHLSSCPSAHHPPRPTVFLHRVKDLSDIQVSASMVWFWLRVFQFPAWSGPSWIVDLRGGSSVSRGPENGCRPCCFVMWLKHYRKVGNRPEGEAGVQDWRASWTTEDGWTLLKKQCWGTIKLVPVWGFTGGRIDTGSISRQKHMRADEARIRGDGEKSWEMAQDAVSWARIHTACGPNEPVGGRALRSKEKSRMNLNLLSWETWEGWDNSSPVWSMGQGNQGHLGIC